MKRILGRRKSFIHLISGIFAIAFVITLICSIATKGQIFFIVFSVCNLVVVLAGIALAYFIPCNSIVYSKEDDVIFITTMANKEYEIRPSEITNVEYDIIQKSNCKGSLKINLKNGDYILFDKINDVLEIKRELDKLL